MIDLTPLDVRKKRGDFKKMLRGYDPQEVDVFLELVADRLEDLVREVLQLRERADTLQKQVSSQTGREHAVQEALVTAQELRKEIRGQAEREAELILQEVQVEARRQRAEAEAEVRALVRDAERRLEQARDALEEMERRRVRFLRAYRQLLEREMDVVEVEEERAPLEDRPIDLDLGGGRSVESEAESEVGIEVEVEDAEETEVASEAELVWEPLEGEDEEGPGPMPPLDVPVDELAALYEGLEDPLDELATRLGVTRLPPPGTAGVPKDTAASPGRPTGPAPGERKRPENEGGAGADPERDLFSPPGSANRDEDSRWG
jgi:cell division initiation protein